MLMRHSVILQTLHKIGVEISKRFEGSFVEGG